VKEGGARRKEGRKKKGVGEGRREGLKKVWRKRKGGDGGRGGGERERVREREREIERRAIKAK
jgi:hypothetical protein